MRELPRWMGARDEPLHVAIIGDVEPWRWPDEWWEKLKDAACIRPDRPLSETLYPERKKVNP